MNVSGSKSEGNLYAAFAGESQAFMKYTLYAEQAKKDGYVKAEQLFTQIAQNEKAHAEIWLKEIHGGNIPKTEQNLQDAASGEHYEWTEMYAEFAKIAEEEGFSKLSNTFKGIGDIESRHDQNYSDILIEIQNGNIFKSQQEETWECLNCGHYHNGMEAPGVCPVCQKPQAYFKKEPKK